MPDIFPFRALHYRAGDVTSLVTQPYDRIDAALQKQYYDRHPHNFVRVDKPYDTAQGQPLDPHKQAAVTLSEWMRTNVLLREPRPALYAYHQIHGGKTRKGVTALVRLEDRIHKHEETHTAPKADRLAMLRATRTHISHVFLLYSDPEKAVNRVLDEAAATRPMLEAKDDFGEVHKVWKVDDPKAIEAIRGALAEKDAIIADGHHRYETAVNYRNEMRAAGAQGEGDESFENVLATLVNMDDGLTIFGTHRVIRDLEKVDLSRLGESFEIRDVEDVKSALAAETERPAFGLVEPGRKPRLLVVRDAKQAAEQVKAPKSEAWRSLDVNILHSVILEGMLGITPEHTAKEMHVDYVRSADEAMERVRTGRAQVAFLVNPVRLDQIRTIVAQGERFPQKTTDFYPKLLSGLLLCPLAIAKEGTQRRDKGGAHA